LAKAYFTPYGVGLGHASRMMMLAERLGDSDVDIRFSSFGEGARYISMQGYECMTVPPVEFAWSIEGGFSVKYSISNIPLWFTNFPRQIKDEINNIIKYDPNIVVSDTRLSSLVASKILNIPSVVILNQVKLLLSPRLREFKICRAWEKMNGEFLGLIWRIADRILVPDLPPPYTIAEQNIWETSSVMKKLEYVGFTAPKSHITEAQLRDAAAHLGIDRSKPIVFIHISGPLKTRIPIIRTSIEACKSLRPEIQYVISEGRPGGDIQPKKITRLGWYYEWCPIRDEIFAMSDVLVLRGGHTTISQAIQFGKPLITIPIENHSEQLGNSNKIAKIGIGIRLEANKIKANQITCAIHQLLDDNRFQQKAEELMRLTERLDGIDNIVKIVRSYF
jgi:UDP-N-acetylglucosamine--N-acetylmuramyl-(pentapeptide) pyrophosphoryl-undecaprenol N-acetylglucosamine transferase